MRREPERYEATLAASAEADFAIGAHGACDVEPREPREIRR